MTTFHVAVQKRADAQIQIYVNGSLVADWGDVTGLYGGGVAGTGLVAVYNWPLSSYLYGQNWKITCLALRVSARLVYSGSTYTVPSPTDLTADFDTIISDVTAMNPAHIIYQCLTDTAWGMGYPTSALDDASFTAAANTLY